MDKEKTTNPDSLNEEKSQQEEYAFIQEVIKNETVTPQVIRGKLMQTIGYGIIFGVVVSVIVAFLAPRISPYMAPKKQEVDISVKEEEEEASVDEKVEQGDQASSLLVLQSLNAVAVSGKKSMVSVCATLTKSKEKIYDSGILIADNGNQYLVLTSLPIKEEKEKFKIKLADEKEYEASLVKEDPILGIRVLAIDKSKIKNETAIAICSFGDASQVENGDTAILLGYTDDGEFVYTYGLAFLKEGKYELPDGNYQLLTTNVQMSSMHSGVMLDEHGCLIGLFQSDNGIYDINDIIQGYAISDISSRIELLSNGIETAYMGVYGMDVDEKLLNKQMPEGVYVKEVVANSPAMKAGIQSGDIITKIDESDVTSMATYMKVLNTDSKVKKRKVSVNRQSTEGKFETLEFDIVMTER